MNKKIYVFVFLLFSLSSFSQVSFDSTKISSNLMKVVHEIVSCKCIDYGEPGFIGRRDNIPSISEKFSRGSNNEFLELIKHPSKEVRYRAFYEVAAKVDTFNFMPYLLKSFKTNEIITTGSGCFPGKINFSDFLIYLFEDKMTLSQHSYLDSVLVFDVIDQFYSNRKLESLSVRTIFLGGPILKRDKLIYSLPLEEKYYLRLKEINRHENNPLVTYSILKYNKPEDSSLLFNAIGSLQMEYLFRLSQDFWCYKAIYENPHDYYYKSLLKAIVLYEEGYNWLEFNERYMLILALTQYQNAKSKEIILKLIDHDNQIPPTSSQIIHLALEKNKSEYFKSISDSLIFSIDELKMMESWKLGFDYLENRINNQNPKK